MSGEKQKVTLCREYRDFYVKIIDLNRNKYSFFLVNPLNDFLSNGFWEICKTKEWGIKTNFDEILQFLKANRINNRDEPQLTFEYIDNKDKILLPLLYKCLIDSVEIDKIDNYIEKNIC